jgi:FKBP-type peptidyl-prolyl cis-trans isomerase
MRTLIIVVLLAAIAGAVWWLGFKRPAEVRAEQQAQAEAEHSALTAKREAMFGAEALGAEVQWKESGLGYRILHEGSGAKPPLGATVRINYVGRLADGTVFDRSPQPRDFRIGTMIPGMNAAAQMLSPGGKGVFFVPPRLGYGGQKVGPIPPNSGLIFEMELVAVNP